MLVCGCLFFFKQKTAYEMRISDWSSDVCSSDLLAVLENPGWIAAVATNWWAANRAAEAMSPKFATKGPFPDSASIAASLQRALDGDGGERFAEAGDIQIGRAAVRERGCQYG